MQSLSHSQAYSEVRKQGNRMRTLIQGGFLAGLGLGVSFAFLVDGIHVISIKDWIYVLMDSISFVLCLAVAAVGMFLCQVRNAG